MAVLTEKQLNAKLRQKIKEQMYKSLIESYNPVKEHKVAKCRQWRFDYAFPDKKIAVELEGGTFTGGRHTTGTGYRGDCIKYNCAASLGWTVLRFTYSMPLEYIDAVLNTMILNKPSDLVFNQKFPKRRKKC